VKFAVQLFWLNGKLALSDAHFEGIPEEVSSSSHVKFAIQPFLLNGKLALTTGVR
jgi:hypothetical protein